jgi:hypothetical protein
MNPTKLVLHFSDFSVIFYAIYKKQENSLYYFSCTFAAGTLERILALQCGPWGRPVGAGCQNSASSPAFLAGRGRGKGLGASGARFGHLVGTMVAPASWARLVSVDGPVSCSNCRGGWWEALNGLQKARDRSSPRPVAGTPAAYTVGRGGGSACRGTGQRRLYSEGRAGARERGSAGMARTIGQRPYCAGQGGRTAVRRSRVQAGGQRRLWGLSACVLPRDGGAALGRCGAPWVPRHDRGPAPHGARRRDTARRRPT